MHAPAKSEPAPPLDGHGRALRSAAMEPLLSARELADANGAALEFQPTECAAMESLVLQLLTHLRMSDFMLAFPGRPALCTIHHHKQLWWQTTDAALYKLLTRCVLP